MSALTMISSDLDEARSVIGEYFYPTTVDVLSPGPWTASFEMAPAGPIVFGDMRWGTDIRARFGELGAYHVDVPLTGELVWRQGADPATVATTRRAAVFQPVGDTTLDRWGGDCRVLAVKIGRTVLESALSRMLDRSVSGPVRLGPELDVSRGAGATWLRLARLLAADAGQDHSLARHPVVGRRLQESLVDGLLLAVDHAFRDDLDHHRPGLAAPGAVRRAAEAMRAEPARPFTIADLAGIARVSPRSLQDSFQRYLGTSPMAHLREIRLGLAHEQLRAADPGLDTVTEVAYRCGFVHLGRFAALYRRRYGESPSRTLRS